MRLMALVICAALAGCDISPWQGPGEVWIYERGTVRHERVVSATFWSSRTTCFTTTEGRTECVGSPVDYRRTP